MRIAQMGDKVAWGAAGSRGTGFSSIPDYLWLDTGQAPERDR